jgi:hypothetical protein
MTIHKVCIFNFWNQLISMGIGRCLLVFLSLIIGSSSIALGDCDFLKPETVIGKADVIKAVKFKVAKKNACFPNRGKQLGKIEFQYEWPEGSHEFFEVTVYYDSASHCYFNGIEIKCSEIQAGAEIGDVRYFERDSPRKPNRPIRGVLNRLFLAP